MGPFNTLTGGEVYTNRLEQLWRDSRPTTAEEEFDLLCTREDIFRDRARKAGFSNTVIELFLNL